MTTIGDSRGIQYSYKNGYTQTFKEAQNTNMVYYSVNTMDAFGNVTDWDLGNGHTGAAVYDPKTGYVQKIVNNGALSTIQHQLYEYDGLGNLRTRTDRSDTLTPSELQEVFAYDDLNRLTSVTFNGTSTLAVSYDNNGNILTKSDIDSGATYAYGIKNSQCSATPGVHALSGIGSTYRYCYDQRGNQTHTYLNGAKTREVNYTGYDKPSRIWSAQGDTSFYYDAQYRRFKREDTDANGSRTTHYVGGNEVVIHSSGLQEYKRYIGGIAINVVSSEGTAKTNYFYRDHIGSLVAIADNTGQLTVRMSYDAFGKRRVGHSWQPLDNVIADSAVQTALAITQTGFTKHEHVDHANIIHLGGRIYDPTTGRFVQADPMVQAPENGQSLNRYTYVFNNPLSYTDPTGYATTCKQKDENGGLEDLCTDSKNEQRTELNKRVESAKKTGVSKGSPDKVVDTQAKNISSQAFNEQGAGLDNKDTGIERGLLSTAAHTVLGTAGMVPFLGAIPDGLDTALYAFEGDEIGAGFSAAATGLSWIPGADQAAGVAKLGHLAGVAKAANRAAGTHRQLKNAGATDSHHVIQDAAAKNLPGYSRMDAPTVQLRGPSTAKGSEHYIATQVQRQRGGGTYAAERRIGYKALRKAGLSKSEARSHIQRADEYFGELGVTPSTSMRQVGNRNR